jgi:hypothetical protein
MAMKKLSLSTTIIIFLLICCDGIQAQTTQSTLNQVDLMKQFIGTWEFELAKDTTVYWDLKSYGIGMEGNFRIATKGKTLMEGKQLWGYDNNLDKWISAQMMKGVTMQLYVHWFTSINKWTTISYKDISNPDKTSEKWDMEFKSPDVLTNSWIRNNEPVVVKTFTRVKE